MNILFVCTGNSCRSVMAEFLLNRLAAESAMPDWKARSCGIAAEGYFQIPPGVKKVLAKRAIPEVQHTPQLVSRPLMSWADAIYAMARGHLEVLGALYPEHRRKTQLFLSAAGLGEEDVADPIGQSEEVYDECCRIIEQGIRNLLREHAKRA